MAGSRKGLFQEKISRYLRSLMEEVEAQYGRQSHQYRALYNQYVSSPQEQDLCNLENLKHYESFVKDSNNNKNPIGVERLYKRQLVIDLTLVCAAHCRYCLRSYYDLKQLSRKDIDAIVAYCADDSDLREVLVTGGDPLIVQKLLKYLISELVVNAPSISIIRIGTRLPVQAPERVNDDILSFLQSYSASVLFEVALQVNHAVELTSEARTVLSGLQNAGVRIYSQNVLLKNVNDDLESLIELYDTLRYLGIESHYLFHPIPRKGTAYFRGSIKKGLELVGQLTCSGVISGRVKPLFALMTDVGKVILYEGCMGARDGDNNITIYTKYKLEDRLRWNPGYELPESAWVDNSGFIAVKYIDGKDEI